MRRITNKLILSEIAEADKIYIEGNPKEALQRFSSILNKIDKTFQFDRCEMCRRLGDCYLALDDKDNAIKYYEKYLFSGIKNEPVFAYLGYLYFDVDIERSLEYYTKALKINYTKETSLSAKFNAILKSDKYDQKKIKETFEKDLESFRPLYLKNQKPFVHSKENPDKRLHIGYLSADYRWHAMMTFVRPILKSHDLAKFDFTLYSTTKKPDEGTELIKRMGMPYKDCRHLSPYELAQQIYNDKVDVLVDLSGYTSGKVFSLLYKPAPVIIEYLGFNNTTGMKEIDYVLTDKYTLPPELQKYYTEKPLYIDTTMQRWIPSNKKYETAYREEAPYKKNGFFTFGSFNTVAKINDFTIDIWSNILKKVENSKLYIFRTQMTAMKIELLKKKFRARNIKEDRLIFENPSVVTNHFSFYANCDAALDPVPFSGLTITIELAIMGVPVITMPQDAMHSRGSARINKILGCEELIAANSLEYVQIAQDLASNPNRIDDYRKNLPNLLKNSILMNDYKGFTENLENLYIKAYKDFCQS